ncbi:MAG: MmgE/PrpD family protein [Motilibacteraceae bacterium]
MSGRPGAGPPPEGSAARVLGELAAGVDVTTAPEPVRERLLALVADVLATAVAAADRADVSAARAGLLRGSGGGACTVLGEPVTAPPALAAAVNGLPVAAEQLQDGHRVARGHPGAHLLPSVLAVAESAGASGTQFLSAVLAGYEIGARIGTAMGGTPPGVHDIATWGTLAAAAGTAHLLSHGDPEVVAAALDLAATTPVLPDARTVFDGATGQHLFLAVGAQLAVTHGQAAAAGLRSLPGTLERHWGRWAGAAFDPGALVASVQAPGSLRWTLLEGYLKRHPTCAHLHGCNDAVEDLVGRTGRLEPAEIADVVVRTYAAAATFDDPRPGNELAARFSIPWTVAAGLALGGLGQEAFSSRSLGEPALLALAARVRVEADPRLEPGYPSGRPAEVVVRLRDGSLLEAACDRPRGDGDLALADEAVREKPRRLLDLAVGRGDAVDGVLRAVGGLGQGDLGSLTSALRDVWAER